MPAYEYWGMDLGRSFANNWHRTSSISILVHGEKKMSFNFLQQHIPNYIIWIVILCALSLWIVAIIDINFRNRK